MKTAFEKYQAIHKKFDIYGRFPVAQDLSTIEGLTCPGWVRQGPVYELFFRTFTQEGTIEAAIAKLPYLNQLGIKSIWLMPFHPIGKTGRKGTLGSPYSIQDYYQVNPQFGTRQDLVKFISACHELNIKVIMDLVINHVANDFLELRTHPTLVNRDEQGQPMRKRQDWSDVADLNYNNLHTRNYIRDMILHWVREFGIDGFRCDVAGLIPIDFWESITRDVINLNPDFFMLAEWENPYLHLNSFHATYDWTLYWIMKGIKNGSEDPETLIDWIIFKQKFYPAGSRQLRFTENHDQKRAIGLFGENLSKLFAVFIFTIPGIALIHAGQEFGCEKNISLFEKEDIDWAAMDYKSLSFYTELIRLNSEVVKKITKIPNAFPGQLVSYICKTEKSKYLVALNFSDKSVAVKISPDPSVMNLKDILNGEVINFFTDNTITLSAYSIKILKVVAK